MQREKYFAQPPIELLRQWFDHGGWYERKPPCPFRAITDTQFVGSMGPPGECIKCQLHVQMLPGRLCYTLVRLRGPWVPYVRI
eukprot:1139524-Pelagomonas_calceolata.AAC.18